MKIIFFIHPDDEDRILLKTNFASVRQQYVINSENNLKFMLRKHHLIHKSNTHPFVGIEYTHFGWPKVVKSEQSN